LAYVRRQPVGDFQRSAEQLARAAFVLEVAQPPHARREQCWFLARFGLLLLDDGRAGQTQVIPQKWLDDSLNPDPDVRAAFASSENEPVLPGGWYRNQFWFVPGSTGDVRLCLGIHGQMVHVDRATRTVAVKLSSWPEAQNGAHLIDTVRAFGAVGAHLAGG